MTERSGEVEQGSSQGPARISRRSFCKRAVAAGLGVAAVGAGVFMAAERLGQPKKDQASKANNEEQVVSNESLSVFGNWFVFRKANIDAKSAEIKPNLKPVFSKEGQQIGQVVEVSLEANPQENQASLDFIFNKGTGKYLPSTNGWQSWANSVIAGQSITIGPLAVSPTDKLVGMHPSYE
ncbi:hypothetical protein M1437_03275, partial [Patescibacteria group bacterium]|nr:hypothetical protein [Patescibacteria group bacterium]